MSELNFPKECRAYDSLSKLMDEAQKVRGLFDSAGLSLPEPLARLFGGPFSDGNDKGPPKPSLSLHIPKPEKCPPEAEDDWIWIPVKDLTPTALLLAVLRSYSDYAPSKAVVESLSQIRKGLNPGSIFNIAARLSGSLIERSANGWRLASGATAPILCDEYGWGPASAFGKYELAAHRRLLIEHLLTANYAGLQIVQIVSQLTNSGLCHAPTTKELVKADLETMQREGRARRRGNSKKWELIEKSEGKR